MQSEKRNEEAQSSDNQHLAGNLPLSESPS